MKRGGGTPVSLTLVRGSKGGGRICDCNPCLRERKKKRFMTTMGKKPTNQHQHKIKQKREQNRRPPHSREADSSDLLQANNSRPKKQ